MPLPTTGLCTPSDINESLKRSTCPFGHSYCESSQKMNDWPINLSPPGEKPFSFTAHVQIITRKKAFRQKDITNSTRPTSRALLPADFNAEQMWNLSSFSRKLNLLIVHLKVHTKSLLTAIQYNLFLLFLNALY